MCTDKRRGENKRRADEEERRRKTEEMEGKEGRGVGRREESGGSTVTRCEEV